jgi:hypothetical protein
MKKKRVKIRAWKQDEVPVGAVIKFTDGYRSVISASDTDGLVLCGSRWHGLSNLPKSGALHSTDPAGLNDAYRTWLPCGVLES